MLRKIFAALIVATALVATPAVAFAADGDYYPPTPPPTEPSLAGSAVAGMCVSNDPYITYNARLSSPDSRSTVGAAMLMLSDGSNTVSIPLPGNLATGPISGRVLWPGASAGDSGKATGWPGWEKVAGRWVYTGGNFGWTRSVDSATISAAGSEISVPLSYPGDPSACAGPAGLTGSGAGGAPLSATGVSPLLLPIGAGALAVGGVGVMLLLLRRRAAR